MIEHYVTHRGGEGTGVVGCDEKSGNIWYDDFSNSTGGSGHHRQPASLCLKRRHAEGFVAGGPDEEIRQGKSLRDRRVVERSHPGYSLVEWGEGILDIASRRPVADHF
jgi:hypothetical protein